MAPTSWTIEDEGGAVTDTATGSERDARALAFHPLSFQEDGDEVTVGLIDQSSFVVLPADGAALLRRLVDGATATDAAAWFLATFGEPVDVAAFIDDLDELGFLRKAGETPAELPRIRWMRLGRMVFSPVGALTYVALIAAAIAAMVRSPVLVPSYRNLFFTHYMSIMALTFYLGQMPLILLHEVAHALAGRRLGLRSRLSIGRRLYFIVFQTTMDGLVGVPRGRRVLPILAGMLTDIGVVATLTLLAAATRDADGRLSLVGGVLLALAFTTVLRVAWQGWFFLQTDVYYLVVTVLGCVDLQTTARQLLANRLRHLLRRPARYDPALWHPRDYTVARWYSGMIVAGYGIALAVLATNVWPATIRVLGTVLGRLAGNGAQGGAGLADSAVILLLTVGELSLAAALFVRDHRHARPGSVSPSVPS